MFIPKSEIRVGTSVALAEDVMTDTGVFTKGHEFNVYAISGIDIYELQDDLNLYTAFIDWNQTIPIKRLNIYPCINTLHFELVQTLFSNHKILFGNLGTRTRQRVVKTKLNKILDKIGFDPVKNVECVSFVTEDVFPFVILRVGCFEHHTPISFHDYKIEFDENRGHAIIEQAEVIDGKSTLYDGY